MSSNGLATILLLIPVLTVPALAIFGVPQFGLIEDATFDDVKEKTGESRIGRSTRRSEDDSFSAFEGFNVESDTNDEPNSRRQDASTVENTNRNSGSRLKSESAELPWDDDLGLEKLNQPQRRRTSNPADSQFVEETANGTTAPNKTVILDKSSRQSKRRQPSMKPDDPVRVAFAEGLDGTDQKVIQAGFDEGNDPEKSNPASKGKRPRNNESPAPKARESADTPLTLKAALERLNELDIRNFRLESGRESGQYIFICSYTPTDTPRVSYRFEAEADEPLKAVEKVLEQIVEWQQRRQ